MTKDKALEELFLNSQPHFDDHDAFMASLTKRLDAVELVRQHQAAVIRRYKMAMVMAFVVGIVCGVVTMLVLLSTPADVPLFTFKVHATPLLWLSDHSRIIAATLLALLMTLGTKSIISNIQDIIWMRKKMAYPF